MEQFKKYRKKPVVVEAALVTVDNYWGLATTVRGAARIAPPSVEIPTLEGTMVASLGDYIIRGIQGEFYPCKPDIFHETYEPVDG